MTAEQLDQLMRSAGDVACLAGVAADMGAAVDRGDEARVHVLAAVLRALLVQASALHRQAETYWMDALREERAKTGRAA
jgi:hypothetical protein